jgi:hypothetical protein
MGSSCAVTPEPGPESGRDGTRAHLYVLDDDMYPDWESVYRDNVRRLYRLMYTRVGNQQDAEDLTAEVFRAALKPLRLAVSKGEVRAYLLLTARTVLASHWRRSSIPTLISHGSRIRLPKAIRRPTPPSERRRYCPRCPTATAGSSSCASFRPLRSRRQPES